MPTVKILLSNLSLLKDLQKIIWLPDSEQTKITDIIDKVERYKKSIHHLTKGDMDDFIYAYKNMKNATSDAERAKNKVAYDHAKERAKSYYDKELTDEMNEVNSDIVRITKEITMSNHLLASKIVEDYKTLKIDLVASSGGRRRTNKKRSTRRKKKRGKRTRNYITKR